MSTMRIFTFLIGGPTAPVNPHPPAALDVYLPDGGGGRSALDQPVTLIGRHPNCNLRLVDEAVGYFQCVLVRTPQAYWLVAGWRWWRGRHPYLDHPLEPPPN